MEAVDNQLQQGELSFERQILRSPVRKRSSEETNRQLRQLVEQN